jgi:heptose-I-phosphate ethanolaminephosphotransferase
MRKMDTFLYFSSRYSSWKRELSFQAALQAKMAGLASDPQLDTLRCPDEAPRTVVFMLGESVTRLDLPYAGYARNTTPELGALGDKITWFSNVLACDPTTVPALCKILTPATIAEPDLWLHKPDLFLMARKTGYKTFWLSNHTTDAQGNMSAFLSHIDRVVLANRGGSRGEGSFDEVLLPLLDEALNDPAQRKFIVLHMLGAHPAYYYRYPKTFARFNHVDSVTRELKAFRASFLGHRNAQLLRQCPALHGPCVDALSRSLPLLRTTRSLAVRARSWPRRGPLQQFLRPQRQRPIPIPDPMMFWHSDSFPPPQVEKTLLAGRPYQTDVLDHTLLALWISLVIIITHAATSSLPLSNPLLKLSGASPGPQNSLPHRSPEKRSEPGSPERR